MFGLINNIANSISDTVSDFVEDPVGKAIGMATQPIRDGIEVFDGLTEGELRVSAAARLGVDVVSGMALSEVVSWAEDVDL